ncbi:YesL family protein [Halalkalibacterium halodurans]|uniref:YesL family protein n=1 Tax=Halalkalibacterium halodurans TaxID=86665 RepID=UPI002E1F165E|nr:DUF624 domain-containing protein [Halalkalibacterium halodurans]
MNGLFSGLYKLSTFITRFAYTNLIWIFFNAPVVYLLLHLIVTDAKNMNHLLAITACLLPFVFFPATTALYGVVRRWIIKENDSGLLITFWSLYKENYRKSVTGGVFLVIFWGAWLVNYVQLIQSLSGLILIVYLLLTGLFITWTAYFFSYIVHFERGVIPALTNALMLAVSHPISTAAVAGLHMALFYLSLGQLYLIASVGGSLVAYCGFFYFYQAVQKTIRVQHVRKEAKGEKSY